MKEAKQITLDQFIRYMSEQHKHNFCFILGAGASKSSGIPTGAELAEKWLEEIKQDIGHSQYQKWLKNEKIDENASDNSYHKIFAKRFEASSQGGYDHLEKIMETVEPSCGYSFLAEIMDKGKHNIVITTNFDSLTEHALFIYTSKKPLVIGHANLADFINVQLQRPQVIKIHHGLDFSPQNTESETKTIDPKLQAKLKEIFSFYVPIVVGYAGNDGGFMKVLQDTLDKSRDLFWCFLESDPPKKKVKNLVSDKGGCFVSIQGFDEFMVLLGDRMEIGLLDNKIDEISKKRVEVYREQLEKVYKNIKSSREDSPREDSQLKEALKRISARKPKSWWSYQLEIQQQDDIAIKEKIYKRGMGEFQASHELVGNYANFLKNIRKNYDEAEEYYLKALELVPEDATSNGNYANFLTDIKKDYDKAEKYYLKALELAPEDATNNGNYAIFLTNIKKDYDKAEKYYLKALEVVPENTNNNRNYAIFLKDIKKDYDKAEKYYLKALKLAPENATYNGNYATLLHQIKKDYDEAEKYYLKALELDPENANNNGNYATFLKDIKKDYDKAEEYYLKALELVPENATYNGNYAIFLQTIKKDYDKAEKYYLKALELATEEATHNGNYAIFLQNIKKDYDKAEKYYLKALKLAPENADYNGNYALFLLQQGALDKAEAFIDKAFSYNHDPENEPLTLELWFYRYACFYQDYTESKQQVQRLLDAEVRSSGWVLDELLEMVRENMQHPEYDQLAKFAEQISDST